MGTNSISQSVCNYHSEGEHQKLIRKLHTQTYIIIKIQKTDKKTTHFLPEVSNLAAISSSQEAGIFP